MNTITIILTVFGMSVIIMAFIAFPVFCNTRNILYRIIAIIASLTIGIAITYSLYRHGEKEYKKWNNGYCQECNVQYDVVGVYKRKNEDPTYVYQCPECKKVIETHFHN